jgi:hypothetical protein
LPGRERLQATQQEQQKVQARVQVGKPRGKDKIGVRVGRVISKYMLARHIRYTIEPDSFEFEVLEDQVAAETADKPAPVTADCVLRARRIAP